MEKKIVKKFCSFGIIVIHLQRKHKRLQHFYAKV
jgi:hypothetical protein